MSCVQCGHSEEEADGDVEFYDILGGKWCSRCRSLMDGWKEDNEVLVLLNDDLSDERKAELREEIKEKLDIEYNGTTNAKHD